MNTSKHVSLVLDLAISAVSPRDVDFARNKKERESKGQGLLKEISQESSVEDKFIGGH